MFDDVQQHRHAQQPANRGQQPALSRGWNFRNFVEAATARLWRWWGACRLPHGVTGQRPDSSSTPDAAEAAGVADDTVDDADVDTGMDADSPIPSPADCKPWPLLPQKHLLALPPDVRAIVLQAATSRGPKQAFVPYEGMCRTVPVSIKVHSETFDFETCAAQLQNTALLAMQRAAASPGLLQLSAACVRGCVQLVAAVFSLRQPPAEAAAGSDAAVAGSASTPQALVPPQQQQQQQQQEEQHVVPTADAVYAALPAEVAAAPVDVVCGGERRSWPATGAAEASMATAPDVAQPPTKSLAAPAALVECSHLPCAAFVACRSGQLELPLSVRDIRAADGAAACVAIRVLVTKDGLAVVDTELQCCACQQMCRVPLPPLEAGVAILTLLVDRGRLPVFQCPLLLLPTRGHVSEQQQLWRRLVSSCRRSGGGYEEFAVAPTAATCAPAAAAAQPLSHLPPSAESQAWQRAYLPLLTDLAFLLLSLAAAPTPADGDGAAQQPVDVLQPLTLRLIMYLSQQGMLLCATFLLDCTYYGLLRNPAALRRAVSAAGAFVVAQHSTVGDTSPTDAADASSVATEEIEMVDTDCESGLEDLLVRELSGSAVAAAQRSMPPGGLRFDSASSAAWGGRRPFAPAAPPSSHDSELDEPPAVAGALPARASSFSAAGAPPRPPTTTSPPPARLPSLLFRPDVAVAAPHSQHAGQAPWAAPDYPPVHLGRASSSPLPVAATAGSAGAVDRLPSQPREPALRRTLRLLRCTIIGFGGASENTLGVEQRYSLFRAQQARWFDFISVFCCAVALLHSGCELCWPPSSYTLLAAAVLTARLLPAACVGTRRSAFAAHRELLCVACELLLTLLHVAVLVERSSAIGRPPEAPASVGASAVATAGSLVPDVTAVSVACWSCIRPSFLQIRLKYLVLLEVLHAALLHAVLPLLLPQSIAVLQRLLPVRAPACIALSLVAVTVTDVAFRWQFQARQTTSKLHSS